MIADRTAPTLHMDDRGEGDPILLVPVAGGDGAPVTGGRPPDGRPEGLPPAAGLLEEVAA